MTRRFIAVALGALLAAACAHNRPDDPPWDAAEMAHALATELRQFEAVAGNEAQLELLAWRLYQREDGARVQVALVWARLDARSWALVQGFRHPDEENAWHRSVTDAPSSPSAQLRPGEDARGTWHAFQRYPQPPTSRQICEFAVVDFLRDPPEGYRVVGGAIRRPEWLRIVGQQPRCGVPCQGPGCGPGPG